MDAQVYSMIVAAGQGSRFGAPTPKQYTKINERTLLEHSMARLAGSRYIDSCYLVIASEDTLAQTLKLPLPVKWVEGGDERWQSVQAGLHAVIQAGAKPNDLVLIHDAARPAVAIADIDAVIEAAMEEPNGATLATPVVDTLKAQSEQSAESGHEVKPYISHTIDRAGVWQSQTPQVFRVGKLHQALSYVAQKGIIITDEASAFEAMSLPIRMVKGSRQNIKLTYPEDLELLQAILVAQSH